MDQVVRGPLSIKGPTEFLDPSIRSVFVTSTADFLLHIWALNGSSSTNVRGLEVTPPSQFRGGIVLGDFDGLGLNVPLNIAMNLACIGAKAGRR
jgi:hypothetical protein